MSDKLGHALDMIENIIGLTEVLAHGLEELSTCVPIEEQDETMKTDLEELMIASLTVTNGARQFVALMREDGP